MNWVFSCVRVIIEISHSLISGFYLLDMGNKFISSILFFRNCKKTMHLKFILNPKLIEVIEHYLNLPSIILSARLDTYKCQGFYGLHSSSFYGYFLFMDKKLRELLSRFLRSESHFRFEHILLKDLKIQFELKMLHRNQTILY